MDQFSLTYFINNIFGLIISLGIIGNLINIIVFSQKKMLKSFTFQLILYLSIIDFLILFTSGIETLLQIVFLIDLRIVTSLGCKLCIFLSYFLLNVRSICLMAIVINSKFNSVLIYFTNFCTLNLSWIHLCPTDLIRKS